MRDWITELIQESHDQYRLAWELMAQSSDRGFVANQDGLGLAISGTPVPMLNVAFVRQPPVTLKDLLYLASRATSQFEKLGVPGMITLPSSWIPPGGRVALESAGLAAQFNVMGMRTARLHEPSRKKIEILQINGSDAAEVLARVNGEAYEMPEPLWRALAMPKLWTHTVRAYAVNEDDGPAAVGGAVTQAGISYVMWMATRERSRGKGYAQAIIHRIWEDARVQDGAKFTVLHATAMGRPIYAKLGYTAVSEFPGFIWQLR